MPKTINETLAALKSKDLFAILRKHNVKHLSVFWSYARWEQRKDSDLDVLLEFEPKSKIWLFKIYNIEKAILSKVWAPRLDWTTRKYLKKQYKPYIEKDLINIF